MSALTDYFTSMANKIRSKVGGSQTYTPLQMVNAIDDVYDAGAASVPSPTSITPSDSSPAALTADTPVTPTANGYAYSTLQTITFSTVTSSNNGVGADGWSYTGLNANYTYILSVMAIPNSGYRQKMYYIKNRAISKTIADINGRSDMWTVSVSGSTVSVSRTGSVSMHIMLIRLT